MFYFEIFIIISLFKITNNIFLKKIWQQENYLALIEKSMILVELLQWVSLVVKNFSIFIECFYLNRLHKLFLLS